jgi:hypothetical protein
MDGGVFIEVCSGGELSNFEHLADLLVTNEEFVYFF